ncbi:hypothetical protein SLNSH_14850 [Alsobacter soli]|uniref:O-antigen ligase-related domain-containing protein n=1 Tax=Alsobacter soli TaxID=2109933 RepID=A0A2T1HRJ8_9HYPH|nr:O-antigen ligase family protein [Alsobacter soli]PSC04266.1 hypothetical protein SLNSH_14850 [Alsobacter soli]
MGNLVSPSFPLYISLPIWGALFVVALREAVRLRNRHAAFLLLACWLRYSISTLHEYTFLPTPLGLTPIAMSSFLIVIAGVWTVGASALLDRRLWPIHLMIWLAAVSAILNQGAFGGVNVGLKWLFVTVFALAAYKAAVELGAARLYRSLALVFAGPILLQWLSVLFDLKAPNYEGVSSFVGGYQHQQAFAILILTFLFVASYANWSSLRFTLLMLLVIAAGLGLANYRTAMLAAAAPWSVYLVTRVLQKTPGRQRPVVLCGLAACLIAVAVFLAVMAQQRFSDIGVALAKGAALIQGPEFFTFNEQRMFSGRPYLWSQYIDSYMHGSDVQILFGFGPESWAERFELYAHNTFVSTLYELGLFGLLGIMTLVAAFAAQAASARGEQRWLLLSFHALFLVLNIGTMPFWTLEGDILYAFLLAQTWLGAEVARPARVIRAAPLGELRLRSQRRSVGALGAGSRLPRHTTSRPLA